jgi:hypothetical protein
VEVIIIAWAQSVMKSLCTLDIINATTSRLGIDVMFDICKALKYIFIAIKVQVIMNQFKVNEPYFILNFLFFHFM